MHTKYFDAAVSILLALFLTACGGGAVRTTETVPVEVSSPTETSPSILTQSGVSPAEVNTQAAIPTNTAPQVNNTGCLPAGSRNKTISVLLVGNSLMNAIQPRVEELLTCGGYTPEMATSNPGGYTLERHTTNQQTANLIAQGYDLTLLQEHSGGIVNHARPYETINTLKNKIESAGSKMGFYQTWEYQERDPVVTESILAGYESVAGYFGAPNIAIGRAWDFFYTSNNESPPFELFADYAHTTEYGQAMIAYVLYAYLTGDSPVYLSSLSLKDDEAFMLQTIAWDTYQAHR